MSPELIEQAGGILGFLLTLMVGSYLLGDNPAYRIAIHTFVGVTAGYVVAAVWVNVLYPQLITGLGAALTPLNLNALSLVGLSWLLCFLLVLKINPNSQLGRFPLAFLVGVGAAVAVGGALTGTLIPQTAAAASVSLIGPDLEQSVDGVILVIGTVSTLLFFWYSGQAKPGGQVDRPLLLKPIAVIGKVFLGITFGVMYAGALAASLAFLAERMTTVLNVGERLLTQFLGP